MKCIIRETQREIRYQVGEPREIVVDVGTWEENGLTGHSYSYHMSKERFERDQKKCYNIYLEEGSKEVKVCTIGYYDFIDFNYEDNLNDRMFQSVATQLDVTVEQVEQAITEPLAKLQEVIREEFSRTEEARAKKEHEEILSKHKKAKRDFVMQYGFSPRDYDRCYNVFGQLMDAEYLGVLNKRLEEREGSKYQSKRYRKKESQKRFHEYLHTQTTVNYSEDEKILLAKFYKALAKKYHPDANLGIDTQDEMTLLNKLKREWGV